MNKPLVIGSRGSDLALWQSRRVEGLLSGECRIEIIQTTGDRVLDKPLQGQLEKGFFTKEIEESLLDGSVDLAVHSLKDLPTRQPDGLRLSAILPRAEVGDVLLVRADAVDTTRPLPVKEGAVIGAGSLRRQALVRWTDATCSTKLLRGNVPTRVGKLKDGMYDAIVMARAGLARLELDVSPLVAFDLNPCLWTCAPGQGAMAVEIREQDDGTGQRVGALNHPATDDAVSLERALLEASGGGCHSPFGCWAFVDDDGAALYVGAPAKDGWRLGRFRGERLADLRDTATTWLLQGPMDETPISEFNEAWLWKPAQSWC